MALTCNRFWLLNELYFSFLIRLFSELNCFDSLLRIIREVVLVQLKHSELHLFDYSFEVEHVLLEKGQAGTVVHGWRQVVLAQYLPYVLGLGRGTVFQHSDRLEEKIVWIHKYIFRSSTDSVVVFVTCSERLVGIFPE